MPALYADRGRGPALQIKGGFPAAEFLSEPFQLSGQSGSCDAGEPDYPDLGRGRVHFRQSPVLFGLHGLLCEIPEIKTPPFPETGTAEFFMLPLRGAAERLGSGRLGLPGDMEGDGRES